MNSVTHTATESTAMSVDAGFPSGPVAAPDKLTAIMATVVFVGGIAPLATDMYVPAFPLVAADLHARAAQVQLSLTTFFLGMALGQLIGGPVSDQRGRRKPLLAALIVLTIASLACAWSPSIPIMLAARFVQGLSGGWAMVIARAVVVDLASGVHLVRSLNVVAGVGGIAPVVGPLMGGLILLVWHWRVSFLVLAAFAAAMTVAVAFAVPETLPPARRHAGGLRRLIHAAGQVLGRPRFVAYLVVMAFSMGVTFAYVATSAFILQSMNGLSPMTYSILFAGNAVGLALATLVAGKLAGRVRTRTVITVGLVTTGAAGLLLLVGAIWWGMPLWVAIVGFLVLMRSTRVQRGPPAPWNRVGRARLPAVVHGRNDRSPRWPRWRPDGRPDGRDHPRPDRGIADRDGADPHVATAPGR
jgi:DHA1 family bicyclomycin/chloramphenicol resistance-like MFS transporter